jgi:uncharacterized protein YodC (DUF2158 family)
LHLALARCDADDEGWIALSDLGSELRAARVKLPGGKLSGLSRESGDSTHPFCYPPLMKRGFQPSSLVQLRSGGPPMVVAHWCSAESQFDLHPAGWRCRWQCSQGTLREGVFSEVELQPAPADQTESGTRDSGDA